MVSNKPQKLNITVSFHLDFSQQRFSSQMESNHHCVSVDPRDVQYACTAAQVQSWV